MSHTRIVLAGVLALTSMAAATAGYANPNWIDCIDIDFEFTDEGECIHPVKRDNGFGNGDDVAPGGSLENNNAENAGGDAQTNPNPNGMVNAPGNSSGNNNPNK